MYMIFRSLSCRGNQISWYRYLTILYKRNLTDFLVKLNPHMSKMAIDFQTIFLQGIPVRNSADLKKNRICPVWSYGLFLTCG